MNKYLRPLRNNFLLALVGLSTLCLLILAGLWRYSGSPLPSTGGAGTFEATLMWLVGTVFIAVPVATVCFWLTLIWRDEKGDT